MLLAVLLVVSVQNRTHAGSTLQDAIPRDGDVLTGTISSLDAETTYGLQERARSAEGDSNTLQTPTNTLAEFNTVFAMNFIPSLRVVENTTSVGTITAEDDDPLDDIESFGINGGADAALFEIGLTTGALVFKDAPNYEAPADSDEDNEYVVGIKVTSGTGSRARSVTQTFAVDVTDETEAPGEPHSLTATPTTTHTATTITLSWQAGENKGPALDGYDVQYHEGLPDPDNPRTFLDADSTAVDVLTATISNLDAETAYTLQVRARSDEGESDYVQITKETLPVPNGDPVLQPITRLSVEENSTGVGTITAADDDPLDDIESFEINGGADAALFEIGLTTGALVFKDAPNYEDPADSDTDNEYLVNIEVTSGTGGRARSVTEEFQVEVTDELEAPGVPQSLTATPTTTPTATTITLSWQAGENKGPALDGYDVQYHEGLPGTGTFQDPITTADDVLTATISNLKAETTYTLQVRARSDEGESDYVQITKETLPVPNGDPILQPLTRLSVEENSTGVGTITAADDDPLDDIESFEINGGADAALFEIGLTTGALVFKDAPNYEDPEDSDTDNEYLVNIEVTSGTGGRARSVTEEFQVEVTDELEAPGDPQSLTATSTVTTITLSWQAGENKGPALEDYQVQYHEGLPDPNDPRTFLDADSTAADVLTATISNLKDETTYTLQVRARSDEGESDYVQITKETLPIPNEMPFFQIATRLSVEENSTRVDTITAQDSDPLDNIVSFEINGGADAALFEIGLTTGALVFKDAPDYEDPADSDTDNEYLVDIKVTSGTGDQARSVMQTFAVDVTDATEAPGVPQSLTATPTTTPTATTITLSWQAGENKGPALDGYDVQYHEGLPGTGTFQDPITTADDVLTATISNLKAETTYTLQVRARSDEGESDYVQITKETLPVPNGDPILQPLTRLSVEENSTGVGTITAADDDPLDDIESFEINGGADAALFEIGLTTGALVFKDAPNYEDPEDSDTDNEYLVNIEVTSGTGGRARSVTEEFQVEVTDELEAPGDPQSLTATSTVTTITLSWQAGENKGPALEDYQVQYHEGLPDPNDPRTFLDADSTAADVLTATISNLKDETTYALQVRARSDEGESDYVQIDLATKESDTEGVVVENPDCAPDSSTICQVVPDTLSSGGTHDSDDAIDFYFFNAVVGFYRLVVEGFSEDINEWLRLDVLDTEGEDVFVRPAFDFSTYEDPTAELIYDFAIDEAGKYYITLFQIVGATSYYLDLTRRTPPGEYLQIGTPISGSIANSDEKDIVSIIGGKGKTYSIRFEGSSAQGFTGIAFVSLTLYGPEHTGYSLYNNAGDFEVILRENVSISSDVDNTYAFDIPTTGGYWFEVEVSGESLVPVVDYTLTLAEETTDQ